MRHKDPELMQRISEYIGDYYRENHSTPTTREISSAMGLAPATGYKYLVEMDKQGLLSYKDGVITNLPKISKTKTGYFSAPLVGSIRCGDPETEEEHVEMYVSLPEAIFGKGQFYLLRAAGDSMVDADIEEGDLILIRKQPECEIGDIVVALDENNENTLKIYVKQWQETYANQVLALGDEHFVETMNNEGLKRRKKKPEKSKKTGKFKRSKRFGKSYQTHAASQLINIIDRKLKYYGKELHRVNTKTFRASQYNHVTNDYIKKRLSKRHLYVNGEWIQRDLYSAFLLMNSKPDLESTDRSKCILTYDNFKNEHDKLIKEYLASDKKYPSSFGLKTCKIA